MLHKHEGNSQISRVQGIKWGVQGVQTLFFRVHQAALGTYIDLIAHNTRMQGLNFGVHVELLQIFLCVQLPRSADWGNSIAAQS